MPPTIISATKTLFDAFGVKYICIAFVFLFQIVRHHLLRAKAPNSILCFEVGNMPRLKTFWQWVTCQSNNAIETFKTPSTKKNNTFTSPRGRNSQSCSLRGTVIPNIYGIYPKLCGNIIFFLPIKLGNIQISKLTKRK